MKHAHTYKHPVVIDLIATEAGFRVLDQPQSQSKILIKAHRHNLANAQHLAQHTLQKPQPISKARHQQNLEGPRERTPEPAKDNFSNQPIQQVPKLQRLEEPVATSSVQPRPDWFRFQEASPREKECLRDFFNSNSWKTPELFLKYRNFIVDTYQQNPQKYLTKTACRRIFHGDACAIARIHSFLEEAGVINRGVTLQKDMFSNHRSYVKTLDRRSFTATVSQKLQVLPQASNHNLQFDFRPNFTSKVMSKTCRALCTSCVLPVGVVWFQSKSQPDQLICVECHNNLPTSGTDQYEKQEVTKASIDPRGKNKWQVEEHGKLLGILANASNGWQDLTEKIPNKTDKQEIIYHFIHLSTSNMDSLKPPDPTLVAGNLQRFIRIPMDSYNNSIYAQGNQQPALAQNLDLDPRMPGLVSLRLKKLQVRTDSLKRLDELNYCNSVHVNPVGIVSRNRMVSNFEQESSVKEAISQLLDDDLYNHNLEEGNFLNNVFSNDFEGFEAEESRGQYGGIFDSLK